MAAFDLKLSGIVSIVALVLVVVGLVFGLLWFFKKAENLTDEDRVHIERSKLAWIGAAALAAFLIASMKSEKYGLLGRGNSLLDVSI